MPLRKKKDESLKMTDEPEGRTVVKQNIANPFLLCTEYNRLKIMSYVAMSHTPYILLGVLGYLC